MSHLTLAKYYQIIFMMVQHHNYSISELENIYPYERDIYYNMLKNHLEKMSKGQ